MANRQVVARRGKTIDFKAWSIMLAQSQDVTAAATVIPSGFLNFTQPATILRARGAFQVALLGGSQIGDEAEFVVGLGIFSSDAVAAGAGSLPDPAAEGEYPWLWYGGVILRSESVEEDTTWSQSLTPVDTKAMRKVKPGQTLAWVGQYVDVVGTPGFRVMFHRTRVLLGT